MAGCMESPRLAIPAISNAGLCTTTTRTIVAVLRILEMAMGNSRFQSRFISMPIIAIAPAGYKAKCGVRTLMSTPPTEKTGKIDPQFDLPASLPPPVRLPIVSALSGPETRPRTAS